MTWDAVAVGNAIMDVLVVADDDILHSLGLTRGTMHPVDDAGWAEVYAKFKHLEHRRESGGSCCNTLSVMARLGAHVAWRGQVGRDELGEVFAQRLTESGVHHDLVPHASAATGKCLSVVSAADAERTMITDLGAAVLLDRLDGFEATLSSARVMHIEGYTLLDGPTLPVIERAVELARAGGAAISVDASDPFVIHVARDRFWNFLQTSADIVFLNAEEARALTGRDPEHAAAIVADETNVRTVVVKLGGRGSIVHHNGVNYPIAIQPVHAIDTTGAGDSYAGGFLYGWLKGWSAERCGRLGSAVAAATVSQMGAVVKDNTLLRALRDEVAAG
jgi:sugar/nucleoside kinase (ribokinase family)